MTRSGHSAASIGPASILLCLLLSGPGTQQQASPSFTCVLSDKPRFWRSMQLNIPRQTMC